MNQIGLCRQVGAFFEFKPTPTQCLKQLPVIMALLQIGTSNISFLDKAPLSCIIRCHVVPGIQPKGPLETQFCWALRIAKIIRNHMYIMLIAHFNLWTCYSVYSRRTVFFVGRKPVSYWILIPSNTDKSKTSLKQTCQKTFLKMLHENPPFSLIIIVYENLIRYSLCVPPTHGLGIKLSQTALVSEMSLLYVPA